MTKAAVALSLSGLDWAIIVELLEWLDWSDMNGTYHFVRDGKHIIPIVELRDGATIAGREFEGDMLTFARAVLRYAAKASAA